MMDDISDLRDLIGKRFRAIQNRHDAITIETDEGQWKTHQAGQAKIQGKYPIGQEIMSVSETDGSEGETVYELITSEGDFIVRSQS